LKNKYVPGLKSRFTNCSEVLSSIEFTYHLGKSDLKEAAAEKTWSEERVSANEGVDVRIHPSQ